MDCQFGLSQRGDAYPIEWKAASPEMQGTVVWVPRYPVGRIQLDDHQRSECDNPASIEAKYREATKDENAAIQFFFQRKIRQLRARPPQAKKLEEMTVRRILMSRENTRESWPQTLPILYRLDELSNLLKKYGFEESDAGERMVLAGMPSASQWDMLFTKQIAIPSMEEEDMQGMLEDQWPMLCKRLKELKQGNQGRQVLHLRPSAHAIQTTGTSLIHSVIRRIMVCDGDDLVVKEPIECECIATIVNSSMDQENEDGDQYDNDEISSSSSSSEESMHEMGNGWGEEEECYERQFVRTVRT